MTTRLENKATITSSQVSPFTRVCFRMQGYTGFTDEDVTGYSLVLRFTPALVFSLTLAGLLLKLPWLLALLAGVALVGALRPGGHPFDLLYNRLVSPLLRSPLLPPNPRPRRFAFLMAVAFLGGAALSFQVGVDWLGYGLGACQLMGSGTVLLTNLCLASWVYHRLPGRFRPEQSGLS